MSDQHPLVCRFGAFGDMIMLTPLLKRLYQRSGSAVDVVGIGNWTATMFQHMPYVRHVYTVNSRSAPYLFNRSQQRLVKQLKSHRYRFAWICEHKAKSYRLMSIAGIDTQHSINARDYPAQPNEHFVERWLRLANLSPPGFDHPVCDDTSLNTELFVADDEVNECRRWLQTRGVEASAPLVCIQAGNKRTTRSGKIDRNSNTKYWPEKNWASVIDAAIQHLPDAQILLCGVPAEHAMTLDIKALCSHQQQVYCVADELPLRRLLALLSLAHSCISVDTGPAHAAAALDCPLTVLFGQADARRYQPLSSTSKVVVIAGRNHAIELLDGESSWQQAHDIKLIPIDDVVQGWIHCTQPN